jgi:hypothetical protein
MRIGLQLECARSIGQLETRHGFPGPINGPPRFVGARRLSTAALGFVRAR